MSKNNDDSTKIITTNRKARHEYFIEDTIEAGLVLTGTEIKSIRANRVSIGEAFVVDYDGELWVQNMHIAAYDPASRENHDPLRPRKLLLHKRELKKWIAEVQQKGYTIVPLNVHMRRGRAKLDIGLAKGKKLYDKRQQIAERDDKRRMQRALRERQRESY